MPSPKPSQGRWRCPRCRRLGARSSGFFPLPKDAPETEPARTVARLRFARGAMPELELPKLGDDAVGQAVRALAVGHRRFDQLRAGNLLEALLGTLDHKQRQAFEAAAPDSLLLPSGRRVRVEYE